MWYLVVALIAVVVHHTVTTSAQTTPVVHVPPVPTTPKWQPPEHDWEFTVYDYPNSLTQPDRCNQTKASYLCDPKSLLNPEVRSETTERLNHGTALGVAIVHKIKVLDASDLIPTMKAEANKILNNLVTANMSKEGSLLFVSVQDKRVVFTSLSEHPCTDLQHSNVTVLFESGNFNLSLSEYVNEATNIYISSVCDDTSHWSPGYTIAIVLVVIISIVLIVVVVHLVMQYKKKKSKLLHGQPPPEQHSLKQHPAA